MFDARPVLILVGLWLVAGDPVLAQDAGSSEEPPRAFQGQVAPEFPDFPDPPADAPMARLRLAFDPAGRIQELAAEPNEPFDVFVVAHGVHVAVRGWEARLVIDDRLTVLERDIPVDLDLGTWPEIRGAMAPSKCKHGATVELARIRMMLTEPATDVVLGLAPIATPSEPDDPTGLDGPVPVYLICRQTPEIKPFDHCETCAVVNPRTVEPERDEAVDEKPLFETRRGRR